MRNQNCQTAFRDGQRQRSIRPLPSGRYKLRECRTILQQTAEEIRQIGRYLNKQVGRYALHHCTPEDKHIWLKEIPEYVANMLGLHILPALCKLTADGASLVAINTIRPYIESEIAALLHDLEVARINIKRNIRAEYSNMRRGDSMLEPLVERAIDIVDRSLSVLPEAVLVHEETQTMGLTIKYLLPRRSSS